MGTVVAVCVVHALKPDRGVGVTAIDKRPVAGPVAVNPIGIYADVQANRVHHGGIDQAVYAYGEDEAERWAAELGRDVAPGAFGENLRIAGIPTSDAIVGERWAVGDHVILEVTLPRTPCLTFARHMGESDWVSRFAARGDIGCYLKVERSGKVRAGDRVEVLSRPRHGVSVRDVFVGPSAAQARAMLEEQASTGVELPAKITAKIADLGFSLPTLP